MTPAQQLAALRRDIAALAAVVASQGKRITALEHEVAILRGAAANVDQAAKTMKPGRVPAYLAAPILARVADAHGLTPDDIRGRSHTRPVVLARWEAMSALRAAGASTTAIGRAVRRDHTTVMHGLLRWAEMTGEAGICG